MVNRTAVNQLQSLLHQVVFFLFLKSLCRLFRKEGFFWPSYLWGLHPLFLAARGNLWNFSLKNSFHPFVSSPFYFLTKSKLNSDNTAHCDGLPLTPDTVMLLFHLPFVLLFYGSLCCSLLCCFFQIMLPRDFCISMTEHCLQPCQIVLWSCWISQTKVRPDQNLVEIT